MPKKTVSISIYDAEGMDLVKDLLDGLHDISMNFTISVFDQDDETEDYAYNSEEGVLKNDEVQ